VRTAFFDELLRLGELDKRIMLVVGDLGFGVVTEFVERLPQQFLNAGVAEQNMTGLAAGMALSGRIAVTYSIANFPTLRCLEQIRNDVCYHNANVKIVAVGGGFTYGSLGPSHHATEDIAIMRTLPNMLVVAPGDPVEARLAARAILAHPGPCYLRLGRGGEASVHLSNNLPLRLGEAIVVREGSDVTLISTGAVLPEVVVAADRLRERGLGVRVLSMHTVKPLDVEAVRRAGRETDVVLTIEEHSVIGGLGGAVAECLMEADHRPTTFRRLGLRETFSSEVGDQTYLRTRYGLDADGIVHAVEKTLMPAVW